MPAQYTPDLAEGDIASQATEVPPAKEALESDLSEIRVEILTVANELRTARAKRNAMLDRGANNITLTYESLAFLHKRHAEFCFRNRKLVEDAFRPRKPFLKLFSRAKTPGERELELALLRTAFKSWLDTLVGKENIWLTESWSEPGVRRTFWALSVKVLESSGKLAKLEAREACLASMLGHASTTGGLTVKTSPPMPPLETPPKDDGQAEALAASTSP